MVGARAGRRPSGQEGGGRLRRMDGVPARPVPARPAAGRRRSGQRCTRRRRDAHAGQRPGADESAAGLTTKEGSATRGFAVLGGGAADDSGTLDRRSVASGKRVWVRVESVGGGITKKK